MSAIGPMCPPGEGPGEGARGLGAVLVTGGAGFIGGNFIRFLFDTAAGFSGRVVNLDALTYAGNPASLADIEAAYGPAAQSPRAGRYRFVKGDITDRPLLDRLFRDYHIDAVAHFAAESHVDRSIAGPEAFITTNVLGTFTLLEAAREAWRAPDGGVRRDVLFHHVSTDEVFGSLGGEGYFTEESAYNPRSPYSASKAGSDHLVRAWGHTYGLPVTLSNCSNNYGPYQFPEKLIPLMILNMVEGKELPVYGDGRQVRDWLYVGDHCAAIWAVMRGGAAGETYAVGGGEEWENIRLLDTLIDIVAAKANVEGAVIRGAITYVKDRPGHDKRYAIEAGKIRRELGWRPEVGFREGLEQTVEWYLANSAWVASVRTGAYRDWITQNYTERA